MAVEAKAIEALTFTIYMSTAIAATGRFARPNGSNRRYGMLWDNSHYNL